MGTDATAAHGLGHTGALHSDREGEHYFPQCLQNSPNKEYLVRPCTHSWIWPVSSPTHPFAELIANPWQTCSNFHKQFFCVCPTLQRFRHYRSFSIALTHRDCKQSPKAGELNATEARGTYGSLFPLHSSQFQHCVVASDKIHCNYYE